MLRYATPGQSNGVPVFKTHIQEWATKVGHLGGYKPAEKGAGALFG